MPGTSYNYLRLSLTDRCNFNCFYCLPSERKDFLSRKEILSTAELLSLVETFVENGIRHVRLTGGEPLLREDISCLIEELSGMKDLECLSLTTNGFYLKSLLNTSMFLALDRINISLDTLKPERFRRLTGIDAFNRVAEGILRAQASSIRQVKCNVVLMHGFNDDEILDFVRLACVNPIDVRFIEYFETSLKSRGFQKRFVPTSLVKDRIEKEYGPLEFLGRDLLSGPAQYYRAAGLKGRIGFISSVTDSFCDDCNRLRLTADGKLYPCLHADMFLDLKKFLAEKDKTLLTQAIREAMFHKKHYNKEICVRAFEMSSMGG